MGFGPPTIFLRGIFPPIREVSWGGQKNHRNLGRVWSI